MERKQFVVFGVVAVVLDVCVLVIMTIIIVIYIHGTFLVVVSPGYNLE